MRGLFIDTSTQHMILAYLSDAVVVDMIDEVVSKDMSSQLFPKLDQLLKKNAVSIQDIDKLYVVVGPGSFTGVRIGVTVAKTMAWSMKIPIVPISSLEVLASGGGGDYICSFIDARRDCVYAGIYDCNLDLVYEDSYLFIDSLKNIALSYSSFPLFVGYEDNLGMDSVLPNIQLERVIKKHLNDFGISSHEVNPIYLKLTEAEEKSLNDCHS